MVVIYTKPPIPRNPKSEICESTDFRQKLKGQKSQVLRKPFLIDFSKSNSQKPYPTYVVSSGELSVAFF